MKHYILLIGLLCLAQVNFGQSAVQKTLVKTFNGRGVEQVTFQVESHNVVVKRYAEAHIRVFTEINYHNSDLNRMKYLIAKGRYNLQETQGENGLMITCPGIQQAIPINREGDLLKESISFTVYVPENMAVIVNDGAQASVTNVATPTMAQ